MVISSIYRQDREGGAGGGVALHLKLSMESNKIF